MGVNREVILSISEFRHWSARIFHENPGRLTDITNFSESSVDVSIKQ